MTTDQFVDQMFDALANPNEELTEWEDTFVESVRKQWKQNRELSIRQKDILERIYDEKTP